MQILFDNEIVCKKCQSLWGFSAYLHKYKLLFDTGSNGRILLQNMKKIGVDVQEIEAIFISHSHWDHIGGLDSIIELNSDIRLYVPSSLSKYLIRDLKLLVKEVIVCTKKPMHLFDTLYTTGLLGGDMPEQSLIVDEVQPRVVTGCGHYGIENITEVAREFLKKDIKRVEGGFHLLRSDDKKIFDTINRLKDMGVTSSLATHCTGERAINIFQRELS